MSTTVFLFEPSDSLPKADRTHTPHKIYGWYILVLKGGWGGGDVDFKKTKEKTSAQVKTHKGHMTIGWEKAGVVTRSGGGGGGGDFCYVRIELSKPIITECTLGKGRKKKGEDPSAIYDAHAPFSISRHSKSTQ